MKRFFRIFLLLVIVVSLLGVYLYVIPRFVGDRFVNALIAADVPQMESLLCDAADLDTVRQDVAGAGGDVMSAIGSFFTDTLGAGNLSDSMHHEAAYYIFTGDYVFKLVLDGSTDIGLQLNTGLEFPDVTLRINHSGLGACVSVG